MSLARLKKAESYIQNGKLDRAEKELRKYLASNKTTPEAWLMLASVYGQVGRFDDVVTTTKKAIALNPNHAMSYSLLGSACVHLGKLDTAIDSLEKAAGLMPGSKEVLNNLGNIYYVAGKFDDAERCFRQVLEIDRNYPQSNFGLAKCLLAQCMWADAIQHFQKAYAYMSDNYEINMSLGKAHVNLGHLGEAFESIERATRLTDRPSMAYYELAHVAQLGGELEKAREIIEKSIKHDAGNIIALAERAEILSKMGELDQAHEAVISLVSDDIVTPAVLITWGNICRKFDECTRVIDSAEKILADDDRYTIGQSDRISLHYMLGALYDKQGDYDRAFEHYRSANTILPDVHDRQGFERMVSRVIGDFDATAFDSIPVSECGDDRPVFIVGMPRSGTSLVEQILSSHHLVCGAGELNEVNRFAQNLLQSPLDPDDRVFTNIDVSKLNQLAEQYLGRLQRSCGDTARVTDKMPSNFIWLGFIMQMFPNARIIHCNRDPRDTSLSIYFQQFSGSHDYANSLQDIASYYRQYERLMLHWNKIRRIPIHDVYYDELVGDIEAIARGMVEYLGLPWDENCLAFHESRRTAATASWDQVRQPVYTRSLARWKNYEQFIGPLIEEFGAQDIADTALYDRND